MLLRREIALDPAHAANTAVTDVHELLHHHEILNRGPCVFCVLF